MRKLVLVIDQDSNFFRQISANVNTKEFDVVNALTPEEGLQMIADKKPAIVLLDNSLCRSEYLQQLKEISPSIYVIIIVRNYIQYLDAASENHDIRNYILQPLDKDVLKETLELAVSAIESTHELPLVNIEKDLPPLPSNSESEVPSHLYQRDDVIKIENNLKIEKSGEFTFDLNKSKHPEDKLEISPSDDAKVQIEGNNQIIDEDGRGEFLETDFSQLETLSSSAENSTSANTLENDPSLENAVTHSDEKIDAYKIDKQQPELIVESSHEPNVCLMDDHDSSNQIPLTIEKTHEFSDDISSQLTSKNTLDTDKVINQNSSDLTSSDYKDDESKSIVETNAIHYEDNKLVKDESLSELSTDNESFPNDFEIQTSDADMKSDTECNVIKENPTSSFAEQNANQPYLTEENYQETLSISNNSSDIIKSETENNTNEKYSLSDQDLQDFPSIPELEAILRDDAQHKNNHDHSYKTNEDHQEESLETEDELLNSLYSLLAETDDNTDGSPAYISKTNEEKSIQAEKPKTQQKILSYEKPKKVKKDKEKKVEPYDDRFLADLTEPENFSDIKEYFNESAFEDIPSMKTKKENEEIFEKHDQEERNSLFDLFDEMDLDYHSIKADAIMSAQRTSKIENKKAPNSDYFSQNRINLTETYPEHIESKSNERKTGFKKIAEMVSSKEPTKPYSTRGGSLSIDLSKDEISELLEKSINKSELKVIVKDVVRESIGNTVEKLVPILTEQLIREEINLLKGEK